MKRIVFVVPGLLILAVGSFLILMRFRFVVGEGYPTWQAVRNYLIRDGEIVIRFPRDVEVLSATCDDASGEVSVTGRTVTTKIGYTWCTISIRARIHGSDLTYRVTSQKLNNWNRILFVPIDPSDPYSKFSKYENGVQETDSGIVGSQNVVGLSHDGQFSPIGPAGP